MLRAVYAIVVCLCVCVSVSVSVTLRYCNKTAKRSRVMQITPHDTPVTDIKVHGRIRTGSPPTGRQMQVGWVKIGHFRLKTRYNSKTVQDRCIVFIKVE